MKKISLFLALILAISLSACSLGGGPKEVTIKVFPVDVFFPNSQKDPQMMDCSKTFAVTRKIQDRGDIVEQTLNELINGPTEEEKAQGYFTNINPDVGINQVSLNLETGLLQVDFDDGLNTNVAGSCKVTSIRAQIEDTLKQFTDVKEVMISINGESEAILQP